MLSFDKELTLYHSIFALKNPERRNLFKTLWGTRALQSGAYTPEGLVSEMC